MVWLSVERSSQWTEQADVGRRQAVQSQGSVRNGLHSPMQDEVALLATVHLLLQPPAELPGRHTHRLGQRRTRNNRPCAQRALRRARRQLRAGRDSASEGLEALKTGARPQLRGRVRTAVAAQLCHVSEGEERLRGAKAEEEVRREELRLAVERHFCPAHLARVIERWEACRLHTVRSFCAMRDAASLL